MLRKYFFTADSHFFHRNAIKYCNRPFVDEVEMNERMVENWNSTVGKHDVVYHLGDIALSRDHEAVRKLLLKLNGQKHIVWGNHDRSTKATILAAGFHDCGNLHMLNVPVECNEGKEQQIVLCHYAMRTWQNSHWGTYHLYGHSHGTLPDDPSTRSCDVGVDCWNFTPVSLAQIHEVMSRKTWKPIDQHDAPI